MPRRDAVGPEAKPEAAKSDWKAAYRVSMSERLALLTEALINIRDGASEPMEVARKALEKADAPLEAAKKALEKATAPKEPICRQ